MIMMMMMMMMMMMIIVVIGMKITSKFFKKTKQIAACMICKMYDILVHYMLNWYINMQTNMQFSNFNQTLSEMNTGD